MNKIKFTWWVIVLYAEICVRVIGWKIRDVLPNVPRGILVPLALIIAFAWSAARIIRG